MARAGLQANGQRLTAPDGGSVTAAPASRWELEPIVRRRGPADHIDALTRAGVPA